MPIWDETYCVFRFDAASPGIVFVKTTSESSEEQFDLMVDSDDLLPSAAPVTMKPPGLGYERQQYLYKNIRRYVKDCYKDVLRPSLPERPKGRRGGARGRRGGASEWNYAPTFTGLVNLKFLSSLCIVSLSIKWIHFPDKPDCIHWNVFCS